MPFSRYFELGRQNHPWLFFNIFRKQMQHFINKPSFWVLQPYHVAMEYQEGWRYKSKLMRKILPIPKCSSNNLLLNIQGTWQVSFLDSLPQGSQPFYSHGKADLLNLPLAGIPLFQQHHFLLCRKPPACKRNTQQAASSFARGTTCTQGIPARKNHS